MVFLLIAICLHQKKLGQIPQSGEHDRSGERHG